MTDDVTAAKAETEARIALAALTQPDGNALNVDVDMETATHLIRLAIRDINDARYQIRADEWEGFRSPWQFSVDTELAFRWDGIGAYEGVVFGFSLAPPDDVVPRRPTEARLAAWVWTAQKGDRADENNEKRYGRLNRVLDVLEAMRAWIFERRAWVRSRANAEPPYR